MQLPTIEEIKTAHPWLFPVYSPELMTSGEYQLELLAKEAEIAGLVAIYSLVFPYDFYKEPSKFFITCAIAHQKTLEDRDRLITTTMIKQIESGQSLNFEFLGGKDYFSQTTYGQQLLSLKESLFDCGGLGMTVI